MTNPLAAVLRKALKLDIKTIHPVSGGSISNAGVGECADGTSVFIKWNEDAPPGFFAAEAEGLRTLERTHVIRVPKVMFTQDDPCDGPPCIVMELLTNGPQNERGERNLGEALSALHHMRAEQFGFSHDNFIGLFPQKNGWLGSWGEFFFERRLVPQVEMGHDRGWLDANYSKHLESRQQDIIALLDSDLEPPSLLHGDLWSGNVFWTEQGPALIDPAVYYGNREADLAFTELFGGFSATFYEAYEASYPLAEGYHERKSLLNLYHVMNHANLFGGSYVQSAKEMLKGL